MDAQKTRYLYRSFVYKNGSPLFFVVIYVKICVARRHTFIVVDPFRTFHFPHLRWGTSLATAKGLLALFLPPAGVYHPWFISVPKAPQRANLRCWNSLLKPASPILTWQTEEKGKHGRIELQLIPESFWKDFPAATGTHQGLSLCPRGGTQNY